MIPADGIRREETGLEIYEYGYETNQSRSSGYSQR